MKKTFLFFLAVAASVGTTFARVKIGDLYYNLDDTKKTAEVTYYSTDTENYSDLTSVTISPTVTYNSVPYDVTSIGELAFTGCHGLTELALPNSIVSIGNHAFIQCEGLTTLIIPNSVKSIGEYAFDGCSGLTSLTIGDHVTSIGKQAFANCTGLVNAVVIPNSVTSLGVCAFYGCEKLPSVTLSNAITTLEFGVFNKCHSLTSIEIPDGVTSIGEQAFYFCKGLTSITIPNSVKSIGELAFLNCKTLESITLPSSITSIGEKAFKNCTALKSIVCEAEDPPTCGSNAFQYINSSAVVYVPEGSVNAYKEAGVWSDFGDNIKAQIENPVVINDISYNLDPVTMKAEVAQGKYKGDVVIPSEVEYNGETYDVTAICEYAFYNSDITAIAMPNSVTSIGHDAFQQCKSLTVVTLSSGLTNIANYTFYLCTSLPSITIPDGVTSLGDGVFYGCTSLAEVTLPRTLESIGNYVFWDCTSLPSITLPASLTALGNFVFHECTGLTSITSLAVTPPTCTENAFETLETTLPVYVPGNGLEDYNAHDAWKRFYIRCILPSNLTITNITSNSAVISWTPSGDEMLWSISIYDFGEGVWWDDFMVTQNPLTLAGLKPNDSYLIAVKAIFTSCSSGFTDYESFSTSPATGIGEITNDKPQTTNKFFRNGILYIECNGKTYNAQGVVVK